MTTPVTPAAASEYPISLLAPTDGEIANSASLIQFMQPEMDALDFLRFQFLGKLDRRCWCETSPQLNVAPMGHFLLNVSGSWRILSHGVLSTFDVTLKGATLVPSSRFWVYAYAVGSAVDFEVSTTPPDTGWRYKNGDMSRIFVTTFFTDKDSTILQYGQTDMEFKYTSRSILSGGLGGNLIQARTRSAGGLQVDLGDSVPIGIATADVGYELSADTMGVPFGGILYSIGWSAFPRFRDAARQYGSGVTTVNGDVTFPIGGLHKIGFMTEWPNDLVALWATGFKIR